MAVHENHADHVGSEFDGERAAVTAAAEAEPALSFLAYYRRGVYDFGVDRIGDPDERARRARVRLLGRQFCHLVSRLDHTLAEARTGGLIRVVLHGGNGAAFCDAVVPDAHLFGLVLTPGADEQERTTLTERAAIRSADRSVAALATRLRATAHLPSANPGGWETAGGNGRLAADGEGDETVTEIRHRGADNLPEGELAFARDSLRRYVRPQDLQFLAFCANSEPVLTFDRLADPVLAPYFQQITVSARRAFYHRLSREVGDVAARINRTAEDVVGGLLHRLVLDVEQGAVYYYRLGACRYLMGVTLDQDEVSTADDRMAELARSFDPVAAGPCG
ncbi:hypothetical protein AB0F52_00695 [Amycolatopsis sp. NPDC024027]|uniref:hypothetical protein n=1 Tax=Amycolatopsis sp. NPDC024027 TaxID=3154327 RepID=UPI0033E05C6A